MKLSRNEQGLCDFCAVGDLAWVWTLPEGFVLTAFQEVATGDVEVTRSAGSIGACVKCDRLIRAKVGRVRRLARRIFRVNPTLRALEGEVRARAMRGGIKIWSRRLGAMSDRRPYIKGREPMEGLRLDYVEGQGPTGLN